MFDRSIRPPILIQAQYLSLIIILHLHCTPALPADNVSAVRTLQPLLPVNPQRQNAFTLRFMSRTPFVEVSGTKRQGYSNEDEGR